MALAPGTRLGNYEIVAAVGAGGMGEVYRSRDPRLNRDVAIKVLSPQLANDPAAVGRFEREAMSVARLSHPNILSIFEFVQQNGTAFVVTEFVEGETLRARLEGGPLAARRAVSYALQIARGIAAAHARGIVHRDLKPENVMITRDDHVKIRRLRKVAVATDGAVYPVISPKGDSLIFVSGGDRDMFSAPIGATTATPTRLSGNETGGKYFGPTSWSSDGALLTGPLALASGHYAGVGVYDLGSRRTTEVSSDKTGGVQWLPHTRRLLYFTNNGTQLVVVDYATRVRTVVDVRLPAPATDDTFAIAPDGRAIYYGAARAEADIWIVERK